jgi:hypothetical protein
MFQGLLAEIRSAVISRIFLYRPRIDTAQEEMPGRREQADGPAPAAAKTQPEASGKKRKRHRH